MPEALYIVRNQTIDRPFRPVWDEIIINCRFSTHIKSLPGFKIKFKQSLLCCNPNFRSIIFCLYFYFSSKYFITSLLSLCIVKRKRTRALLGSNLPAILFTDTLYKGRFSDLPFTYTGIQIWLKKTQCCALSQCR